MASARTTVKSSSATSGGGEKYDGFTDDERDAMKERAKELKTAARRGSRAAEADGETEVRARIAEMPDADRALAERIHEIVRTAAPDLAPKLWYGMPAYARDGKVVCFFQSAQKFKSRYATLGFSDLAQLDDGALWATSYALTALTADDEARIAALVERAAG
ncbi:iron chaperone [Streptomyces sp. P9-A4]|uniref:iron chaperone n=1 Tax=Streptomyces sp. P9-A4 TaxID=3072285 RepID=UPI002FC9716E